MAFTTAQLADMVEKVKLHMQIGDDDEQFQADGIAVFCSATDATAATVQVTDTQVILIITGGANAGTTTLTLADAANDTLDELATVIDGTAGWTANLVGEPDATSTLLTRLVATGCLAQANEQVLRYENEALLEQLITNALAIIETAINRKLMSDTFTEEQFVQSDRVIMLDNPLVTSVTQVAMEHEDGLTVKYTGTDEIARVEVTDTAVKTITRTGATTTTTSSTFAANVTTTAMATTINALSGWTATVVNARPSAYLVRRPAWDAKDTLVTLEVWEDTDHEYEVDYPAGVLLLQGRSWSESGKALVVYDAGYSTLPSDLEQVILELVKAGFDAGKVGAGLKKERLGDYAYELGDVARTEMASALSGHTPVLSRYVRLTA